LSRKKTRAANLGLSKFDCCDLHPAYYAPHSCDSNVAVPLLRKTATCVRVAPVRLAPGPSAIYSLFFSELAAGLLAYMFWPKNFDDIDFSQFSEAGPHSGVVAHGVNDNSQSWAKSFKDEFEKNGYDGHVFTVDWQGYAKNTLRCAIDGKRIGERLAETPSLGSVHLIGHSCGSFVVYGACRAIIAKNRAIVVQTKYLDPVSIYGLMWRYGINKFGSCADYGEAYIDTGDAIPGSHKLLPSTRTYDVTAARLRLGSTIYPHMWPTYY
jgi:hypothetical protein